MFTLRISILFFFILLVACDNSQLQAPTSPAAIREVPANWAAAQKERRAAKAPISRSIKSPMIGSPILR